MPLTAITEQEFLDQVLQYAKLRGWERIAHFRPARTATGWRTAMQGNPGFPDLLLLRRGVMVVAELKRSHTQKPTVDQQLWLEAFREVPSCNVFVWRPDDWSEIERILG